MNWKPLPVAGFFDRQQRTTFTVNGVQWVSDRIALARADICTKAAADVPVAEIDMDAWLGNLHHTHHAVTVTDDRGGEHVELGTHYLRLQHDWRLWEAWSKAARPELSFVDGAIPAVSWWRGDTLVGLTALRRWSS